MNWMTKTRRTTGMAIAAVTMVAATAVAGPASTAAADATAPPTARNGVCDEGEFCLYYYSDYGGSLSDFASSVLNYGSSQPSCYEFRGPGAGQGRCVKNNAMSAWNRSRRAVTVYYNSNCRTSPQVFASGQYANLNSTLSNDNASHCFN